MTFTTNHLLWGVGLLLALNINQRGREDSADAVTAADDLDGTGSTSGRATRGGILDSVLSPILGPPKTSSTGGGKSPTARNWLDSFTKVDRHEAALLAARLHVAFDGWGTDEDEILSVGRAAKLKKIPYKLIAWYFEAAYNTDLTKTMQDEMSWSSDAFTEFMNTVPR